MIIFFLCGTEDLKSLAPKSTLTFSKFYQLMKEERGSFLEQDTTCLEEQSFLENRILNFEKKLDHINDFKPVILLKKWYPRLTKSYAFIGWGIIVGLLFLLSILHHIPAWADALKQMAVEIPFMIVAIICIGVYGLPSVFSVVKSVIVSLLHPQKFLKNWKKVDMEFIETIFLAIVVVVLFIAPIFSLNRSLITDVYLTLASLVFVLAVIHWFIDYVFQDNRIYRSEVMDDWEHISKEVFLVQFGDHYFNEEISISDLENLMMMDPDKDCFISLGIGTVPLVDGIISESSILSVNVSKNTGNNTLVTIKRDDILLGGSEIQEINSDNGRVIMKVMALGENTAIGKRYHSVLWDEEDYTSRNLNIMLFLPIVIFLALVLAGSIIGIPLIVHDHIDLLFKEAETWFNILMMPLFFIFSGLYHTFCYWGRIYFHNDCSLSSEKRCVFKVQRLFL